LEGALEAKEIELKESASLVDRVKALHGEQCHELQRQIEEVRKRRIMKSAVKAGLDQYAYRSRLV